MPARIHLRPTRLEWNTKANKPGQRRSLSITIAGRASLRCSSRPEVARTAKCLLFVLCRDELELELE